MQLPVPRSAYRAVPLLFCLLVLLGLQPAYAAEKARLRVDDYVIDAELIPARHQLIGRAQV